MRLLTGEDWCASDDLFSLAPSQQAVGCYVSYFFAFQLINHYSNKQKVHSFLQFPLFLSFELASSLPGSERGIAKCPRKPQTPHINLHTVAHFTPKTSPWTLNSFLNL